MVSAGLRAGLAPGRRNLGGRGPSVTGRGRLAGWASGAQLPPPSTWGPRALPGWAVLPPPAFGPGERPRDHRPACPATHLPSVSSPGGLAKGVKGPLRRVALSGQVSRCADWSGDGVLCVACGGAGAARRRRPRSELVSAHELLRGPCCVGGAGIPLATMWGFTGPAPCFGPCLGSVSGVRPQSVKPVCVHLCGGLCVC